MNIRWLLFAMLLPAPSSAAPGAGTAQEQDILTLGRTDAAVDPVIPVAESSSNMVTIVDIKTCGPLGEDSGPPQWTGVIENAPPNAQRWSVIAPTGTVGIFERWQRSGLRISRESVTAPALRRELGLKMRLAGDGSVAGAVVHGCTAAGSASEYFKMVGGKAGYANSTDHGQWQGKPGAFYLLTSGTLDARIALFEAMIKRPNREIDLLPSGRVKAKALLTRTISNGRETKVLTLYRVTGLVVPWLVWADGDHLFATLGDLSYVPVAWENALKALADVQSSAIRAD